METVGQQRNAAENYFLGAKGTTAKKSVCLYKLFPLRSHAIHPHPSHGSIRSEPVFLNVYGAQESIPRNEFRQPM